MKKWSIYIVAAFVWAGCSDEIPDNPIRPVTTPAKEGEVALTIKFPNSGGPSTYADADIDGPKENKITRLDILSFTKGTGSLLTDSFKYHIVILTDTVTGGIDLDASGITKKVRVKLQNMVEEQRLVIIANLPNPANLQNPIDFTTVYKEKTMQHIVDDLQFDGATWRNPAQANRDTTSFPMFGQMTKHVKIHSTEPLPSAADMTFQMIRAVAKIDVYVDKFGTGDPALGFGSVFKIEKVHVYNASSKGYIAPNADYLKFAVSTDPNIQTKDTIIEKVNLIDPDPTRMPTFNYPFPSSGNRLGNLIYIPESGILNGTYEPAYLVIEATYYGEKFYYRIDFTHNGEYKPILRNHNYDINITGVRTKGYTSLDAARDAPVSRFGALELSQTDDIGLKEVISYNNEYYLAVSATHLNADFMYGPVKIYIKSSFTDGAWAVSSANTGSTFLGYYPGSPSRDHNSSVAGKLDSLMFYLTINNTGVPIDHVFNITSGMLTQTVTVTQSPGSNSYITKPNTVVYIPVNSADVDGVKRAPLRPGGGDIIVRYEPVLLWKTDGITSVSFTPSVNNEAFNVLPTGGEGNLVVGMTSKATGELLYSWHVWVTNYDPEDPATQKSNNGFIFMDRNLGSMKNSGDNTSSGLYYQWGRKDPFYIDINGVSQFVTDTTKNLYINYLDSAIQHPNTFYAVPTTSTNYDWIGSGQNNNMWSTVDGRKGPFDPCPFGWRLPVVKDDFSGSPWYGITGNTAARANGAVYPLAGYLDAFSGERYEETGSSGVVSGGVWSASARALQATVFKYTGSAAGTEATWRANGYPVRCVKDTR